MAGFSLALAEEQPATEAPGWKVLVVDDDEAVHQVTRLVLADFEFDQRPIEFVSAYSAREARELMEQHEDIALILLDVIMETEQSGLELVHHVREVLGNRSVRIVLRTGQPGHAPPERVIVAYDINGYREKTELTAQRLFTTVYASLRSYRDIQTIQKNKTDLERLINSSAKIFRHETTGDLAGAVTAELGGLLKLDRGLVEARIVAEGGYEIVRSTGHYAAMDDRQLPLCVTRLLTEAAQERTNVFSKQACALYVKSGGGDSATSCYLLAGETDRPLDQWQQRVAEMFCRNVSIALRNTELHRDLTETQNEMVYLLADAVESRSQETGNHVKRVAKQSHLLASALGLSSDYCELLELAAPLHDIGKIAIPDDILAKPGAHSEQESAIMRTHANLGSDILSRSTRPAIQLAAEICRSHHENWDGTGYPGKLKAEAIPISGRIVAVADVFDALGSRRCYKEPWEEDDIKLFFTEQRGKKFDPKLVDLLMENWDEATAIRNEYPDSE